MLDLKAVGLGDHDDIFIDITISDCGTGKPAASHKPGSKSNRKGEEKRFVGLPEAQMCYPSYGGTGSKNKDAKALHKRISNAIASADPSVSLSVVSSRVNQVISVAIQRAMIAFKALEFMYTKIHKGRVVGKPGTLVEGGVDWNDDMDDDEFKLAALTAASRTIKGGAKPIASDAS